MRSFLLAGLAVCALALAACAPAQTSEPTQTPVPTSAAPTPTGELAPSPSASAVVPQALRFTATTVNGKTFDGASLVGQPTVFWFWAAWCPKCRGDAAQIRDLQQQQAGKVNIVGVAGMGSGAAAMKNFVSDYHLDGFPQLADDAGAVWQRFSVPSQHYYVILDSSGQVVHTGPLTVSQLKQKISELR
jgi:peroxiredoxin